MIARMWPVAGVVGENGAFYFAYDRTRRRMRRSFAIADAQRAADREKLARVRARILAEVQGAAVSADQLYREADLAIDFCEDVPTLPVSDVDRIKRIFEEEGAVAKVSSIHVNGWYGAYDKLTMTRRFADDILGVDIDAERDRIVFVGDSPNDAPMFGFFPNACGVANVLAFQGRIDAEPLMWPSARAAMASSKLRTAFSTPGREGVQHEERGVRHRHCRRRHQWRRRSPRRGRSRPEGTAGQTIRSRLGHLLGLDQAHSWRPALSRTPRISAGSPRSGRT